MVKQFNQEYWSYTYNTYARHHWSLCNNFYQVYSQQRIVISAYDTRVEANLDYFWLMRILRNNTIIPNQLYTRKAIAGYFYLHSPDLGPKKMAYNEESWLITLRVLAEKHEVRGVRGQFTQRYDALQSRSGSCTVCHMHFVSVCRVHKWKGAFFSFLYLSRVRFL